jgi:hypothetical protein
LAPTTSSTNLEAVKWAPSGGSLGAILVLKLFGLKRKRLADKPLLVEFEAILPDKHGDQKSTTGADGKTHQAVGSATKQTATKSRSRKTTSKKAVKPVPTKSGKKVTAPVAKGTRARAKPKAKPAKKGARRAAKKR